MGQEFSCDMCGAKFQSKEQLDQHTKSEHAATPMEPTKTEPKRP